VIRTLAWKEYREQRTVWAALAALTAVLVGGGALFVFPSDDVPTNWDNQPLMLGLACVMAWAYGMVCGSMLLAGEREARTQSFLEALTGRRAEVWKTKVAVGAGLVVLQALLGAILLTAVSPRTGPAWFPPGWWVFLWLAGLALVGLLSFAWSVLFSALCRTVLAAVGWSALVFNLVGILSMVIVALLQEATGIKLFWVFFLFQPAAALAALWASRAIFCRDDQLRQADRHPGEQTGTRPVRVSAVRGVKSLLWLAWRQGQALILVLLIGPSLVGLVLVFTEYPVWPFVALLIGLGSGVGVFAGEQSDGAQRFLGNQRLSLGGFWAVKTAFWLAVAAGLAALALGEGLVLAEWLKELRGQADMRGTAVPHPLEHDRLWMSSVGTGRYLLVWLVYGFSISQFFILVVRKAPVALVLSSVVSGVLLLLWVPSLIVGGVSAWQLWAVPVLLLAAGRLAMWPWAPGGWRVGSRLCCCGAADCWRSRGWRGRCGTGYCKSRTPASRSMSGLTKRPSRRRNRTRPAV
jgi:hypothetical protein